MNASAQERVRGVDARSVFAGLRRGGGGGGARVWQHPPSAPLPPQHPVGVPLAEREAARVLQKRVLRGSDTH